MSAQRQFAIYLICLSMAYDGFFENSVDNATLLRNSIAYANRARTCTGDFDGDSDIDLTDLAIVLSEYGAAGANCCLAGDVDHSGNVDLVDLAAVLTVYGSTCP